MNENEKILPRRARSITEENSRILVKTPCNSEYSVVNSYLLDTSIKLWSKVLDVAEY
jgi:hypothetical protein